jgi:hypothetical protein
MEITRDLIEKRLSRLLIDDEAGWEGAANEIEAKICSAEGIELANYNSPGSFSSALMDRIAYQENLQERFADLDDFEVAEELVWLLLPSGFIFGE